MPKTTTKKGKAGKASKAPAKKPADDLDDLAAQVDADLEKDFDFPGDDADSDTDGGYLGKTVRFTNDEGKVIVGKVIEEEDGKLTVEDDEAIWEQVDTGSVKLVDEGTEAEEPEEEESEDESESDAEDEEEPEADETAEEEGDDSEDEDFGDLAEPETAPPPPAKAKGKGKAKPETPAKVIATEEAQAIPAHMLPRLIKISDIVIPEVKAREFDPESPKWKRMVADLKKRGQRQPVFLESWDTRVLVDGLRRVKGHEALGRDEIFAVIKPEEGTTTADRLWNGLLDNAMREEQHWTDLALGFMRLVADGTYTQRRIAQAFGKNEAEISRMIAAMKLPKPVLQIARKHMHEEDGGPYSQTVFMELATASKDVVAKVQEAMEAGKPVSITDVRALKRAKKASEEEPEADDDAGEDDGEEKPSKGKKTKKPGAQNKKPSQGLTYRDLPRSDVGDYVKVRVTPDHVELKFHIDWSKKTYRNFDPIAEIKELLDVVFHDQELAINSREELQKAMTAARSELGE